MAALVVIATEDEGEGGAGMVERVETKAAGLGGMVELVADVTRTLLAAVVTV